MANGKVITGKWTHKGQELPEMTEDEARTHIEKLLWRDGEPVCRHCGSVNAYRMSGATVRPGLCRCRDCDKQFTVTVGTIFEDSHIPLAKWVKAFHLMASSKKGMSALQLQRNLALGSYRSAWHLAHRIRLVMKCEPMAGALKGQIQVDETYVGGKPRPFDGKVHKKGRGTKKAAVLALVETNGNVHSRHVERIDSKTLKAAMDEACCPSSQIVTDELPAYRKAVAGFAGGHSTVNHASGQYVNEQGAHTNTVESYFSLLKRGVYGTFHHVSKKHLHRYCSEFDFRWNGRSLKDVERREMALKQVEGKRLMYKSPVSGASQ
jgi:transposase-like protein